MFKNVWSSWTYLHLYHHGPKYFSHKICVSCYWSKLVILNIFSSFVCNEYATLFMWGKYHLKKLNYYEKLIKHSKHYSYYFCYKLYRYYNCSTQKNFQKLTFNIKKVQLVLDSTHMYMHLLYLFLECHRYIYKRK